MVSRAETGIRVRGLRRRQYRPVPCRFRSTAPVRSCRIPQYLLELRWSAGGVVPALSVFCEGCTPHRSAEIAGTDGPSPERQDELGPQPVLFSDLWRLRSHEHLFTNAPDGTFQAHAAGCRIADRRFRTSGNSDEARWGLACGQSWRPDNFALDLPLCVRDG